MQGASKLTAYTRAIVLMEHGTQPWSYALFRLLEIVLGIGVALGMSFAPKLLGEEISPGKDS
jgi:hypothetical protein